MNARDSPVSKSSCEGFNHHFLVVAHRTLALPAVEFRTESKRRRDLFDLLSPRYRHIELFTHAVVTEVQVGFGSKEFNDFLRASDYCHR